MREVTTILAVEVGERCKVSGCKWSAGLVDAPVNAGFGRARIWCSRFNSRNDACSSMTDSDVSSVSHAAGF